MNLAITSKKIVVNTVANIPMIIANVGDTIKTLGFHSMYDGGEAYYIVKSQTLDDLYPIKISLQNNLQANLLLDKSGFVKIKQLGAKGIGEQKDKEAFKIAINNFEKIKITRGTYKIDTNIFLDDNTTIKGEEGAIIKGMLIINGTENITIQNLQFISFNSSWTYGIRIMDQSAKNVSIINCHFNNKTIIYQDSPKNNIAIDKLYIEKCKFSFINEKENIPITTIQVHCSNLKIRNSTFNIKGIDGCIKNDTGTESIEIENCEFYGDMDEEIIDYHEYGGSFYFRENKVFTTSGGIIRTKPLTKRIQPSTNKIVNHVIENNIIEYQGSQTSSLIYISGSYNLQNKFRIPIQEAIVKNNTINCKIVNRPFNFRGLHSLNFQNNTITGELETNFESIYISSVEKIKFRKNNLSGGRIICYGSNTPSGEKYNDEINHGKWIFEENIILNNILNQPIFYINNQNKVSIYIQNNNLKINNSRNIIEFVNGEYGDIIVKNNIVNNQKQDDSNIIKWGNATQKTNKID